MKNAGSIWEKRIKSDANIQQFTCVKIPGDIVSFYGQGPAIQKKTSFDFAMGINGRSAFFDAKAQGDGIFNFKSKVIDKKKLHQFNALLLAQERGDPAGYLLWLYGHGQIIWLPVRKAQELIAAGVKSVTPDTPDLRKQLDSTVIDFKKLILSDD